MQFFLYEIVARIVAAYLVVDCYCDLRNGLIERKIAYYNTDFLDWLLGVPDWIAHRDVAPVRYWMRIVMQLFALFACFVVAIFGWFHSNT